MTQPRLGTDHLLRDESDEMIPTDDTATDEARPLKYSNVLRHGIQGEAVPSGEIGHARLRGGGELLKQTTPGSMTEREKELVETAI